MTKLDWALSWAVSQEVARRQNNSAMTGEGILGEPFERLSEARRGTMPGIEVFNLHLDFFPADVEPYRAHAIGSGPDAGAETLIQ